MTLLKRPSIFPTGAEAAVVQTPEITSERATVFVVTPEPLPPENLAISSVRQPPCPSPSARILPFNSID